MGEEVGARVVNGKIIVVDYSNEEPITIKASENIDLYINDKACETCKVYKVSSNDKITCNCEKTESSREINVTVSKDKSKAYVNVEYTPEIEYELKDRDSFLNLSISTEVFSEKEPEHFTILELKEILKEKGIVYGIKEEELELVLEGSKKEILIAEGKKTVEDIASEVVLFFTPTQMMLPKTDSNDRVDYKNLFRISNVNAGEKIATIIPEIIGEDGIDIFGKVMEREYTRKIPISTSNGCEIQDNNIISLIEGKAHITNRKVSVNSIYSVDSVNMGTCNIKFSGDIEVYDSIDDNMSVSAGGSLDVSKNVNTSNVVTGGKITILGNAINSKILSGQIDIKMKEYNYVLVEFKNVISKMIDYINELDLKSSKFETNNFIRTLTEEKFNNFQKLALNIVALNIKYKTQNRLVDLIRNKVLGYNISKMKSLDDLIKLFDILDNEIDYQENNIVIPLDVRIGYCQKCEIKSTGNIIIRGKGEYISKLTAMKDILFTKSDSVARGGILSAGRNISAGIVGSKALISTKLIVPKFGRISATVAFENTIFRFGNTEMILDETRENVNIYFDKKTRKIEIGKLAL